MTSSKDRRAPGSGGNDRRDRRAPKPLAKDGGKAGGRVRSLKESAHSKVAYDAKGNPVLEWRTTELARRAEDDTIDYLKALDSDALELAADDDSDGRKPKRRPKGYNPYDKSPK